KRAVVERNLYAAFPRVRAEGPAVLGSRVPAALALGRSFARVTSPAELGALMIAALRTAHPADRHGFKIGAVKLDLNQGGGTGGSSGAPTVWITTAAKTIAPPASVVALGCSPRAIQTQSGPSTISSRVISATSAAGIRRAPHIGKIRPRPIGATPRPASSARSFGPTSEADANGAAHTKTSACESH